MNQTYKLYVSEHGKGRPVILIHGGFTSHHYWKYVEEKLKPKRTLFEPDLLGFGKSPKPRKGRYSLEEQISCLEETFKSYDFSEPPVLVGHSMGAVIALHWAVMHPRRFSGLVLSAPVLFEPEMYRQQIASLLWKKNELPSKRVSRFLLQILGYVGIIPSKLAVKYAKDWPEHVVLDLTSNKHHVFRKLMQNTFFSEYVYEDLKKLKMPLRIVVGSRDFMSNHAHKALHDSCKHNPDFSVHVLETGHQIPLEHPDTIAEAILSV